MNSANRHATVTRMKLTGDEHWCERCTEWVIPKVYGRTTHYYGCPMCEGELMTLDQFIDRAERMEER